MKCVLGHQSITVAKSAYAPERYWSNPVRQDHYLAASYLSRRLGRYAGTLKHLLFKFFSLIHFLADDDQKGAWDTNTTLTVVHALHSARGYLCCCRWLVVTRYRFSSSAHVAPSLTCLLRKCVRLLRTSRPHSMVPLRVHELTMQH